MTTNMTKGHQSGNLTEQYATATALKIDTTTWVLFGNLAAA